MLVPPALISQPYAFSAPADLQPGSHHVEVTAYDAHNTPGKTSIDVTIGPPCEKPADCPLETDTCIGGRCVPGPGVQGGLGQPCTDGTMCAEGQCASDGTNMYCVSMCMRSAPRRLRLLADRQRSERRRVLAGLRRLARPVLGERGRRPDLVDFDLRGA